MPQYNLRPGGRYEGPIRGFVLRTGGGWTQMCSERPYMDRGEMHARGDEWSVPDFAWEREPREISPYELGTLFEQRKEAEFPADEFPLIWRLETGQAREPAWPEGPVQVFTRSVWRCLTTGETTTTEPPGLTRLYREDEV